MSARELEDRKYQNRCISILAFTRVKQCLEDGKGSQTGIGDYYFISADKIDRAMENLQKAINSIVTERIKNKHNLNQVETLGYLQSVMNDTHEKHVVKKLG